MTARGGGWYAVAAARRLPCRGRGCPLRSVRPPPPPLSPRRAVPSCPAAVDDVGLCRTYSVGNRGDNHTGCDCEQLWDLSGRRCIWRRWVPWQSRLLTSSRSSQALLSYAVARQRSLPQHSLTPPGTSPTSAHSRTRSSPARPGSPGSPWSFTNGCDLHEHRREADVPSNLRCTSARSQVVFGKHELQSQISPLCMCLTAGTLYFAA